LKFPNNIAIWRFLFHHPERSSVDPSFLNACERIGGYNGPGPEGAFMLNGAETNPGCWSAANALLQQGVATQTCAEYYYHSTGKRGFNLKFVNCGGWF